MRFQVLIVGCQLAPIDDHGFLEFLIQTRVGEFFREVGVDEVGDEFFELIAEERRSVTGDFGGEVIDGEDDDAVAAAAVGYLLGKGID